MIVAFEDPSARTAFLERLRQERGDIFAACREAKTRPDLVIGKLDSEQEDWLKERLQKGRLFQDIQLDPFSRPR